MKNELVYWQLENYDQKIKYLYKQNKKSEDCSEVIMFQNKKIFI